MKQIQKQTQTQGNVITSWNKQLCVQFWSKVWRKNIKTFNIIASNFIVLCICVIIFMNPKKQTQIYIKNFVKKIKNKNGTRLSNSHVSFLKEGFDVLCRFYDWIKLSQWFQYSFKE